MNTLSSPSGHARHGKVARLPDAARQVVNTMLNDGHSYRAISSRLTELGHPGITDHNLSRWRHGGYEDWLDAQDKFDLEKLRDEGLREMVKEFQDSSALENASETLVALQVFRALHEDEVDPCSSKFLQLLRAAGRQSAERTRRDRLKFDKQVKDADVVNQLLADPKKLMSVLGQLRGKLSTPLANLRGTGGFTPV